MILPVIIAGGTGSRLWPLSREMYPKQFLPIQGADSMLQITVQRLQGLLEEPPVFICNEEHKFILKDQLKLMQQAHNGIVVEPVGRNTAPAIALAAFKSLTMDEDAVLLVLPADHVIADVAAFHEAVRRGTPYAQQGKLIVFGVSPTYPETGYGYIKAQPSDKDALAVDAFVEKPDAALATTYCAAGTYFWNAGMFLLRAKTYLEELKTFQPDIYTHCEAAWLGMHRHGDFIHVDKQAFTACPADSIDYAVMEKTSRAMVVPLQAGWTDVGSWDALWNHLEKDTQGNVHHGDVLVVDTSNSYVRSDGKLLVTIGLHDTVVINTEDAVLVAAKDKVQDVKQIVAKLNQEHRTEAKMHRKVFRPWGNYDSLAHGSRYQVKRITVNPGEKLSIQMHYHRAEHWIVVSGTAKVTKGDETYYLTENQSTYIPLGVVHALENPGKLPLELIEVQSGSYLGEDDIVRFEDRYGRTLVDTVHDKLAVE